MSYPGGFETVHLIDDDGSGEPEWVLCGSGDGRLRLFRLQNSMFDLDLVLSAQTPSHGYGVAGLAGLENGTSSYRVVTTSAGGAYREYDLDLTGPTFTAHFSANPSDTQNYLGKEGSIRLTTLSFLNGVPQALFVHSNGRTLYEDGQSLAPIFIKDPFSLDFISTSSDPLPNAVEVAWDDDSHDFFLLNSKGYIGRVDSMAPFVSGRLQLDAISGHVGLAPEHLIKRTVAAGEYLIAGGVQGGHPLVIVSRDLTTAVPVPPPNEPTIRLLVENPNPSERFFLVVGRQIDEYELDDDADGVTLIKSATLGTGIASAEFSAAGVIESLTPFKWNDKLHLLITEEYGGMVVAEWDSPFQTTPVPYDGLSRPRSKWQALATEDEIVYAMNRFTGEVVEVLPSLAFLEQIHPPHGGLVGTYDCLGPPVHPKGAERPRVRRGR